MGIRYEADIRKAIPQFNRSNDSEEQKFEYVARYLADAKEFTARLASEGQGLVYLIG